MIYSIYSNDGSPVVNLSDILPVEPINYKITRNINQISISRLDSSYMRRFVFVEDSSYHFDNRWLSVAVSHNYTYRAYNTITAVCVYETSIHNFLKRLDRLQYILVERRLYSGD